MHSLVARRLAASALRVARSPVPRSQRPQTPGLSPPHSEEQEQQTSGILKKRRSSLPSPECALVSAQERVRASTRCALASSQEPAQEPTRCALASSQELWMQHVRPWARKCIADLGQQRRAVVLAELCSGLCTASAAMRALGVVATETAISVDPLQLARKMTSLTPWRSDHHFDTVESVTPGSACYCHWHARDCEVPWARVDAVVIGASCKPYSRQRSSRFSDPSSVGTHQDVHLLKEFLNVLAAQKPPLALLEDVLGIQSGERLDEAGVSVSETWLEWMVKGAQDSGYVCRVVQLDAALWLPTKRPRVYVLMAREDVGNERSLQQSVELLEQIVATRSASGPPAPVQDYLAKPGDADFPAFQQRWQCVQPSLRRWAEQGSQGMDRDGAGQCERAWAQQAGKFRDALLARGTQGYHLKPWTGVQPSLRRGAERPSLRRGPEQGSLRRVAVTGVQPPQMRGLSATERSKELLDLAFLQACVDRGIDPREAMTENAARVRAAAGLFCDVSQSIARKPWCVGLLKCYTTSTEIYSYERDAVIEPEEAFRLHGFEGTPTGHGCSRKEMQALIGNCMAAPCVAIALLSLLAAHGQGLLGCFTGP